MKKSIRIKKQIKETNWWEKDEPSGNQEPTINEPKKDNPDFQKPQNIPPSHLTGEEYIDSIISGMGIRSDAPFIDKLKDQIRNQIRANRESNEKIFKNGNPVKKLPMIDILTADEEWSMSPLHPSTHIDAPEDPDREELDPEMYGDIIDQSDFDIKSLKEFRKLMSKHFPKG